MDQKLTDLSELTSPAVGDETYIVDTSDTTHDVSGTSKRITLQSLLTWLQSLTGWNASKLQSKDISDTAPTDNQVLTWDNAASKWKPAPAGTASPLTTKGDLYGYDTTNQRIPVGTDGQVLTADSTDDQGVAWKAAASAADVVGEVPTGTPNGTLTDFTIAQSPITGTLRVFVNGIRQKVTDDYTFTGTTITFVSAPLTGDKIQVDYKINTGDFSTGSCSFIDEEVPVGTVDGSNKTFTLASAPVTGSLKLFRDGQLLTGGGADYTLTTNSIAFVSAPVTGSVLRAYYKSAVSTAGNADLLDGKHGAEYMTLTGTETATNKTFTSPKLNEDVALTATSTEINLLHGKLGAWTSFVPNWSNLTVGAGGTNEGYYCQIGKLVFFRVTVILGTSPSVGAIGFTLPVAIKSGLPTYSMIGSVIMLDAGATGYRGDLSQAGQIFVNVGNSAVVNYVATSSTVPYTWAETDIIYIQGFYEAA